MNKQLDSNNPNSCIKNVCRECGISANVLTCLSRYKARPNTLCYSTSTFHSGVCDFCKDLRMITEVRDFFYPDFGLLNKSTAVVWDKVSVLFKSMQEDVSINNHLSGVYLDKLLEVIKNN